MRRLRRCGVLLFLRLLNIYLIASEKKTHIDPPPINGSAAISGGFDISFEGKLLVDAFLKILAGRKGNTLGSGNLDIFA